MFKYWRIVLVVMLILSFMVGCSKSTKTETGNDDTEKPPIDITPKENQEAELIALCLSGELIAPDSLYDDVLDDLTAIRAEFGDTIQALNAIEFWPPWRVSYLLMAFDESAAQLIADGEYHAWEELNEYYHVTEIKIGGSGLVSLVFDGRLNPCCLAEEYEALPGVIYVEPNFGDGDGPNVYAREATDGLTYLFRNAWGDCPSGCTSNEYWYFIFEENEPVLVGYWRQHQGDPQPEWWEEARLNREHYCD
ncbi:MAG: hypothetical protein WBF13_11230 [Candidatus Zixiibacteriota bacterium]